MSAWLEWAVEHYDRPWLERRAVTKAAERKLADAMPKLFGERICRRTACDKPVRKQEWPHCHYCSEVCRAAANVESRRRLDRESRVKAAE